MRRRRTLVGLLTAVIALAMGPGAMAGPPEGKGKPTRTIEGETCAEYFGTSESPVGEDFTVTMTEKGIACVDVYYVPAGDWSVEVFTGSATEVTVQLRSSVPGDWCWVEHAKAYAMFSLPAPESYTGACPDPGAGDESIADHDPALAFTVVVSGKKLDPEDPVVVNVSLP